VFANLTEAMKRRLLLELRRFWSYDPKYRDVLVDNIQGKYAFSERPQMGIILKGSSASQMPLSADNFQATVVSYCHLAKVFGKPGLSIEWVREDARAIQKNGGVFPSPRGIYFIEVRLEDASITDPNCPTPMNGEQLVFYVDPLLDAIDEQPTRLSALVYQVAQEQFYDGSLRVYQMPGNVPLTLGRDYTADPETGTLTLARPLPTNADFLSVDYRYAGESVGPFPVPQDGSNNTAIPGVVLAFGRRSEDGDIMTVVVGDVREPSAREYGGRWEMSFDMDIMARDTAAQQEITDRTLMFLYAVARNRLSEEGIEITQVGMGGEAEEVYDETGDDYYFTASINLTILTDWCLHVPLDHAFTRVIPVALASEQAVSGLSDEQLAASGSPTGLYATQDLRFLSPTDPFFRDRSRDYELIR
jgi:hypothetical protein